MAHITETVYFKTTNFQFQVKENMNCLSRIILYVITCNGCGEQYLEQTGDILRNRMTVHRQQIREPATPQLAISEYIAQCAKDKKVQFSVSPFYKFFTNNET